jgi:predicted nucleic acid-binding protein
LRFFRKPFTTDFHEEAVFYQSYFENDVDLWVSFSDELAETAQQQARKFGLSALDALHVAAAISARVDEFITTEKPGKPMYRVKGIRVISIFE